MELLPNDVCLGERTLAERQRPVLADTLLAIEGLELPLDVVSESPDPDQWLSAAAVCAPDGAALAALFKRFEAHGLAPTQKAASASLLLRIGRAGAFAIAAYLTRRRVPFLRDYGLSFRLDTNELGLWVRDATFVGLREDAFAGAPEWTESVTADVLRVRLLESLIALTEPIVASQHAWSRFSRYALWAMAVSAWGTQFPELARQLGDAERGVREARAMFALVPEISRAAPTLYEVRSGDVVRTRQRRSACCLVFKAPARYFCTSCPIIPEAERLQRQREWVATQQP